MIRDLGIEQAKTKAMSEILTKLNLRRSTLVVTAESDELIKRSAANLSR